MTELKWGKTYDLTFWQRLKMRLFGQRIVGFDYGSKETCVEGYSLNGKFYVTKIIERDHP